MGINVSIFKMLMINTRMYTIFNTVPNTRTLPPKPNIVIIHVVIMVNGIHIVSIVSLFVTIIYGTIYIPFLLNWLIMVKDR